MNTIKLFALITTGLIFFAACQDVIDIDLDSIEPKLVIEGALTDESDSINIKITKTSDYFEPIDEPAVSNATVTITDENGNTVLLKENIPGNYSEHLSGIEGNEYTLEVEADGEHYTAAVEMPGKVNIDFLSIIPTPEYLGFSGGYLINCHVQDPYGIKNYYRLKVSDINDPKEGDKVIYLFDDNYVDGNDILMQWDQRQFFEQDTVIVELQTMAKSTYDYYRTLSTLFEGGMIGNANPSNPVTNLSNDALGYFGAYTVSRDTFVVAP